MLLRPDLQSFKVKFENWKMVPLCQVPLGDTYVEFLEAALNSLCKEILEIARNLKKDAFIESETSIVGVKTTFKEIRSHLTFLENLRANEDYDEVENDQVMDFIQDIADYLKIENELNVEFIETALKTAKESDWKIVDYPKLKEEDETSGNRNTEEETEERDNEMREKLINQLYMEYLISQTAKNQVQEPEEILKQNQWKKWWWNEDIRFQMQTLEDRNDLNQVKKMILIQKNPLLKKILDESTRKLTGKELEKPKIKVGDRKCKKTETMEEKVEIWKNPWNCSGARLKVLKLMKENLPNGKMKAKMDLVQTNFENQK
jgi:hypothetical protein